MSDELLSLEHPLMPDAIAEKGVGLLVVSVDKEPQGYWVGALLRKHRRCFACHGKDYCPHYHSTEAEALRCAERARDALRAGRSIDW